MIKFFRKIRQNLLMENKTGKYFKYAIGEIVLVVIGILIALQINTWSKTAEQTKNNKIYLNKIIEELKLNVERLDYLAYSGLGGTIAIDIAVKNSDSILKLALRGFKESDLDFIVNTNMYSGGSQLNLFDATYEELLNTGKLYTLGSDEVILAIKNYYKRYEREIEYNRRWTDFTLQGINLMGTSLNTLKLEYSANPKTFDLENYPWYFKPYSEKYLEIKRGLEMMRNGQYHDLRKCNELKEESKQLIVFLDKELHKYQ
tara:strand:+ start:2950 stop:3726 length:777 start_codon:yes stop_codon:yes gene_type:complete